MLPISLVKMQVKNYVQLGSFVLLSNMNLYETTKNSTWYITSYPF